MFAFEMQDIVRRLVPKHQKAMQALEILEHSPSNSAKAAAKKAMSEAERLEENLVWMITKGNLTYLVSTSMNPDDA